jgi:molecular chaperone GrpE
MNDRTARAQNGAAASADDEANEALESSSQSGPATKDPREELMALAREVADLKDRHLRTLAEMENLRRRTEREVADANIYGISRFARDVLGVADNMRRAIDALPAQARANADAGVKALIEGVELTERELQKTLEKHGVRRFDPVGEKFDPNKHQAMYELPDQEFPPGTVAQVVQPGYTIGDRILRPALVAVVKAPPRSPDPPPPANENAGPSGSA